MADLNETADTLDEVAQFADWLAALAAADGDTAKQQRIDDQAATLRGYAEIYRTAANV